MLKAQIATAKTTPSPSPSHQGRTPAVPGARGLQANPTTTTTKGSTKSFRWLHFPLGQVPSQRSHPRKSNDFWGKPREESVHVNSSTLREHQSIRLLPCFTPKGWGPLRRGMAGSPHTPHSTSAKSGHFLILGHQKRWKPRCAYRRDLQTPGTP